MRPRTFYAFRFEWSEKIAHLSPDIRLEIHEAAATYARTGRVPEMSEAAATAFEEYLMPDFRKREKAALYRARAKERKAIERDSKADEATALGPVAEIPSSPAETIVPYATSDNLAAESSGAPEVIPEAVPAALDFSRMSRNQRKRFRRRLRKEGII